MSDVLMSPVEYRTAVVERPEFRSTAGKLVATGVAMRYGATSKPIGGEFREVFLPAAFARSLKAGIDVHSHNEHGGPYLGRTGAGTLRLFDSRSELAYEIDVPDTSAGRDTATLLERGDIRGSSIGFRAVPRGVDWAVGSDGMALRTVKEAKLFHVDLTTNPAYDDSTAEIAVPRAQTRTRQLATSGRGADRLSASRSDLRSWARAEVGRPRVSYRPGDVRRPSYWFV